jgi:hypothetical protein
VLPSDFGFRISDLGCGKARLRGAVGITIKIKIMIKMVQRRRAASSGRSGWKLQRRR